MISYKANKNKNIVFCMVDRIASCANALARETSINLSDQFIFVCQDNGYDLLIGEDADLLLKEAVKENCYTHAVVLTSGTSLGLSCDLFKHLETRCTITNTSQDHAIFGHILDRKERYYELHHQFYIINLRDYVEMKLPNIGEPSQEAHTQFNPIRSVESYHDDYVPLWLKKGIMSQDYQEKCHGWNLIATTLEHGKRISDLGENIRNSKLYVYYEHEDTFLKEYPRLKGYSYFGSNFVSPVNTDNFLNTLRFDGPIEQYVTVCSGFNWIRTLIDLKVRPGTTVVFTDINPNHLEFTRKMLREWDGNNLGDFYWRFASLTMPLGSNLFPTDEWIENEKKRVDIAWSNFKQSFNNWDSVWATIKRLNYKYVPVNYLAEYHFYWLERNKNTYINLSDLFTYSPAAFDNGLRYRISRENYLIKEITAIDPNIYLNFTSRAADGFQQDSTKSGYARDFELTVFDDLKLPPWHRTLG